MKNVPSDSDDSAIARRRKAQVLDAAAECFRHKGFHRTSMLQISEAAGMSSGHIYHYFKSKEDIVVAIVKREKTTLDRLLLDELKLSSADDVPNAMINQATLSAHLHKDMVRASLMLEILAEAARNPKIADVMQRLDRELRTSLLTLLGDSSSQTQSRLEIIAALMDGLSVRAVRNPQLDKDLDLDMLRGVVKHLLSS